MVFEKVKKIIVDVMGVDPEDVTVEETLENLGVDDCDVIEIVSQVEDTFDIEIPESEYESFETVGDIVEYVRNNSEA